ncbi:MAG: DUF2239 family protein [Propionivibrio sp.]
MNDNTPDCIAFDGNRRIAAGSLREVAVKVKAASDANPLAQILVFDARTSASIEIDCRGSVADVLNRIPMAPVAPASDDAPVAEAQPAPPAGPGRPRLGVVAREVTLLPRHWEWLGGQPGGASVALRKLVEQARRASAFADRVRQAQDAAFRFMSAMAGDLENYEDATRALFAPDRARFTALIAGWPADVRDHLLDLAEVAFQKQSDQDVPHA